MQRKKLITDEQLIFKITLQQIKCTNTDSTIQINNVKHNISAASYELPATGIKTKINKLSIETDYTIRFAFSLINHTVMQEKL